MKANRIVHTRTHHVFLVITEDRPDYERVKESMGRLLDLDPSLLEIQYTIKLFEGDLGVQVGDVFEQRGRSQL